MVSGDASTSAWRPGSDSQQQVATAESLQVAVPALQEPGARGAEKAQEAAEEPVTNGSTAPEAAEEAVTNGSTAPEAAERAGTDGSTEQQGMEGGDAPGTARAEQAVVASTQARRGFLDCST